MDSAQCTAGPQLVVPRWQVQRILMRPTRVHQSPGRAEMVPTGRGKPEQAEEPGED